MIRSGISSSAQRVSSGRHGQCPDAAETQRLSIDIRGVLFIFDNQGERLQRRRRLIGRFVLQEQAKVLRLVAGRRETWRQFAKENAALLRSQLNGRAGLRRHEHAAHASLAPEGIAWASLEIRHLQR